MLRILYLTHINRYKYSKKGGYICELIKECYLVQVILQEDIMKVVKSKYDRKNIYSIVIR